MDEREINDKAIGGYGRTLEQMLKDTSFNIAPVVEWLKRSYSHLSKREYGRARAIIQRMLLS
jgi:hypothetical protein